MGDAVDLRAINRAQFTTAKRFWAYAVIANLGAFAVGAAGAFGFDSKYIAQVLLLLAVVSEGLQIWSDQVKGRAESLLRTLDLCRSFGWSISDADKRDIIMATPRKLRKTLSTPDMSEDIYFASTEPTIPRRAVKNLVETAWYTRYQSLRMMQLYTVLILVLVSVSVFALIVASRDIATSEHREQVIKTITGSLMLVVSLSMARSVIAYYRMQERCTTTEATCNHLLNGDVTEADALKQWYEYQLGRSSAPLLPDWLWRMMSPKLDIAWRTQAK